MIPYPLRSTPFQGGMNTRFLSCKLCWIGQNLLSCPTTTRRSLQITSGLLQLYYPSNNITSGATQLKTKTTDHHYITYFCPFLSVFDAFRISNNGSKWTQYLSSVPGACIGCNSLYIPYCIDSFMFQLICMKPRTCILELKLTKDKTA